MNRVNRLHNYNTLWGQRRWMNEAACPGLLHWAGWGALWMSRIACMTNKARPVKPLVLAHFASHAALLRIQPLNLPAFLPAWFFVCILCSCPVSPLLPVYTALTFSLTTGEGKFYIWVFPLSLIQTRRKTSYVSGCKPADPVLPAW